jgi:hypothetical protein
MHIIGLGGTGCKITKLFEKYPQYNTHYIDVDVFEGDYYPLTKSNTVEEAERNVPKLNDLVQKIVGPIIFICAGSGATSGSILATLEQFKHIDINIIYIRPAVSFLNARAKLREKTTYAILQEYARSGLFKKIYLLDNAIISKILKNLSVTEYYAKINNLIVKTVHMLNYLKNSKSVMGNVSEPLDINRISTIGIYDLDKEIENYFFTINNIREKHFYFALNKKTLDEEKNLLNKIGEQVEKAGQSENTTVSYDIIATTYDENYAYIEAYTNFIQE